MINWKKKKFFVPSKVPESISEHYLVVGAQKPLKYVNISENK